MAALIRTMRSMRTIRTVLAATLAAALATPAAADDFCTVLKSVVASAPKGFAAVRGARDPLYPASYWRPVALPGSEALGLGGWPCFVLHGAKMKPSDQYHCDFPGGADRQALVQNMHALADQVSACLAPMFSDDNDGLWRLTINGASVVVAGVDAPPGVSGEVVEVIVVPAK